jgi:outer membrane protein OmpA-like peptidoglycan-associated protein
VTSALGYLLPAVVGKLTPGGSIPSALPADVAGFAAAGQALLSAPAAAAVGEGATAGGGMGKWLPWVIVAAAALFGLSYCAKNRSADTAPVPAASAPAIDPASAPSASFGPVVPAASEPAATGGAAPAASGAAAAATADEPAGSAVVSLMAADVPALKVYFDSGKTDVHGDFAAKSADLVAYLKAHADAKAVISGFNDPTGNAAANAELSKNRAKAVQAALVAQGVAEDRTVLEKPAETSGTAATDAASRRVEVMVRK